MNPIWRAYFSSGLVQPPTSRSLHVVSVIFLCLTKKVSSLCVWKECLKCVNAKNIFICLLKHHFLNECHDWSVVEGNHDIIHLLDRWAYMSSLPNIWQIISMKGYERNKHLLINIMFSRVDGWVYQKNSVSETPQCWGTFWCIHPLQIQWWLWYWEHMEPTWSYKMGHPLVMSRGASSTL